MQNCNPAGKGLRSHHCILTQVEKKKKTAKIEKSVILLGSIRGDTGIMLPPKQRYSHSSAGSHS